ncbi:general secretion pathway protein C [Sphingomonas laterariae]|uniref:General secretion pathway protein C n=1 Tax=Edaphosphingomonas laterariae TaxID=861865 RepID=A0A239BNM3_9SPHN|nr:type II secretion system protein N [Sphingomonas laterariae]SNS09259.1 general secretion pathway protein C [Sphingomonas laterariae]
MRTPALPAFSAVSSRGSTREWLIAAAGGIVLSAGLVALLRPAAPEEPTELTSAPAASSPAEAPAAPPPPATAVPAMPTADTSGLILRGIMGAAETGAAIIEFPGGRQGRFIVGRDVLPGVKLAAIEAQSVLLSNNGADVRIAFPGAEVASLTRTAQRASRAPAGDQTVAFRTGLAPRKREDGRITGFTIRAGTEMPAFAKAGLQPGDVVIGINGRAFASENEVNKLANEIAISPTIVFEYERNGRRSEARLDTSAI